MNKLLVISVLVALLALNTEGFRVLRQAEEEQGPLTRFTGAIKSYYNSAVDSVSGYFDSLKGFKLEERVSNLYTDATTIVGTYGAIFQDQLYHIVYPQQ